MTQRSYYRSISLSDGGGERSDFHPIELLHKIFGQPRLAGYIETIELGRSVSHRFRDHGRLDCPVRVPPESWNDHWLSPLVDEELQSKIKKAVQKSDLIFEHEKDAWTKAILGRDYDAQMAFLFSMLPNVERIALFDGFEYGDRFRTMLERIADASQTSGYRSTSALGRLKKVRTESLRDSCFGGDEKQLEFLSRFSALPSVTTLVGENIACTDESEDLDIPFRQSNVDTIRFKQTFLWRSQLYTILNTMKALKSFTFYFRVGRDPDNFPYQLCNDLLDHAADTLEELYIYWDTRAEGDGCRINLSDIHHFTNLKRLEVDRRSLHFSWGAPGPRIVPLADSLPVSIERLVLMPPGPTASQVERWSRRDYTLEPSDLGLNEMADTEELFAEFAARKQACLPHLKEIELG